LTLLVPIAFIASVFFLRRCRPIFAAGIAIFLISLLPNSGLMPFDWQFVSTVSDRYVYLSLIGFALAISSLVKMWPTLKFPAIAILLLLAIRTELQISTWKNGETLFRHALSDNPNAWYSAGNLAVVIGNKSPDEAIALCRRSINLRSDRADVWNTLGSLLMGKGNRIEAISAFETAHSLSPADPTFSANLARAKKELSACASKPAAPLGLP
jgi:protein O-mannosyl-transferase